MMDKHIQNIFIKHTETSPKSLQDTTDRKSDPTYTETEKLLYDDLNEFWICNCFLSILENYFSRNLKD